MPAYLVEVTGDLPAKVIISADTPSHALRKFTEGAVVVNTISAEEVCHEITVGTKLWQPKTVDPDTYRHKTGCNATPDTPIDQGPCICTKLDL